MVGFPGKRQDGVVNNVPSDRRHRSPSWLRVVVAIVGVIAVVGGCAGPSGRVSPTQTVTVTAPATATSSAAAASPRAPVATPAICDATVIAADLGRRVVTAMRCDQGWAYVDFGGLGDAQALLRLVSNRWTVYSAFPSTICRSQAAADGVPDSELSSFPPCGVGRGPRLPGDLGLAEPIQRPACDGSGIVVLFSAVDADGYARLPDVLAANPGSRYLRTDNSCPSLRQRMPDGSVIYAVYEYAGRSVGDVCAAVRRAGGDTYGKWLDTVSDPTAVINC
jgi:hypothetical protein